MGDPELLIIVVKLSGFLNSTKLVPKLVWSYDHELLGFTDFLQEFPILFLDFSGGFHGSLDILSLH